MSYNLYDKETKKLTPIAGKGDFPCDYGTKEEFNEKKDSLPDGTVFTTTDEFVEGGGGGGIPDYANRKEILKALGSYTVKEDGFVGSLVTGASSEIIYNIDGFSVSNNAHAMGMVVPVAKGSVVTVTYIVGNSSLLFMPYKK